MLKYEQAHRAVLEFPAIIPAHRRNKRKQQLPKNLELDTYETILFTARSAQDDVGRKLILKPSINNWC